MLFNTWFGATIGMKILLKINIKIDEKCKGVIAFHNTEKAIYRCLIGLTAIKACSQVTDMFYFKVLQPPRVLPISFFIDNDIIAFIKISEPLKHGSNFHSIVTYVVGIIARMKSISRIQILNQPSHLKPGVYSRT